MSRTRDDIVREGPGCEHEMCLFERDCFVMQDIAEYLDAWADRLDRRAMGRDLARTMGLTDAEGPLFASMAYAPKLSTRLAAARLLVKALERQAAQEAA